VSSTRIGFMYVVPSPSFSMEIALSCALSGQSLAKCFPSQIKQPELDFKTFSMPLASDFPLPSTYLGSPPPSPFFFFFISYLSIIRYESEDAPAFPFLAPTLKSANLSATEMAEDKSKTFCLRNSNYAHG